jgi:hypothetical protein
LHLHPLLPLQSPPHLPAKSHPLPIPTSTLLPAWPPTMLCPTFQPESYSASRPPGPSSWSHPHVCRGLRRKPSWLHGTNKSLSGQVLTTPQFVKMVS